MSWWVLRGWERVEMLVGVGFEGCLDATEPKKAGGRGWCLRPSHIFSKFLGVRGNRTHSASKSFSPMRGTIPPRLGVLPLHH